MEVFETKKINLITTLMLTALITVSCSSPEPTVNDAPISPIILNESSETKPLTPHNEYMTLVESYIDGAAFTQMDVSQTKQLSNMLLGHYDIIGRTAGEDMNYYLAIRREDAPIYADFDSINIGYYSGPDTIGEVLQIGYYDKDINPTLLYELDGYFLLEFPFGNETLECFCFGVKEASYEKSNSSFRLAFTQGGRDQLDFIKKYGLSFYSSNTPHINFSYQDEDTLKFYSTPYTCFININKEEIEGIRNHLSSSRIISDINSRQAAWNYLHMVDNSIYTTGAGLQIDDKYYLLLGNKNSAGYMMSITDDHKFISLEYNEAIYHFVMNKIQDTVNIDYRDFDAQWFEVPLMSASIVFPERLEQADGSDIKEIRSQTIYDADKLTSLSRLMDRAINSQEIYGFSGCGYTAIINFTREDGETLRIFIATDSCDSMTYEGRIGFEYGNQSDLAAIFDTAMAYRLR